MGFVYYLELIVWFHAVRHIDVSVASSVTVPAPVVTMIFAIMFLGETVHHYQLVAMGVIIAAMYGLLYANARKVRLQSPASRACRQNANPGPEKQTPPERVWRSKAGSPTWTRTRDNSINSRMLYQLSYRGISGAV